ncbi:MAG: hypothetical protein Q7T01_03375 [bacterium]|nr:hypothetical protein [bacterium]
MQHTSEHLRQRFCRFWTESLRASGNASAIYGNLATLYSDSRRSYHTLTHLAHCFRELDDVADLPPGDRLVIEGAIWFHDAIMTPGITFSERMSASFAEQVCMDIGVTGSGYALNVASCIRESAHRRQLDASRTMGTFLDVNLSILGQPTEAYLAYAEAIQREYEAFGIPREAFFHGRHDILQTFNARKPLYYTHHFRERYERAAHENLATEIALLEALVA